MSVTHSVETPDVIDLVPVLVEVEQKAKSLRQDNREVGSDSPIDELISHCEAATEKGREIDGKLHQLDQLLVETCKREISTYAVGFDSHFEFYVLGRPDIERLYNDKRQQVRASLKFSERAKLVALQELDDMERKAFENYEAALEQERQIAQRLGYTDLQEEAVRVAWEHDAALKRLLTWPCPTVEELQKKLTYFLGIHEDIHLFDSIAPFDLIQSSFVGAAGHPEHA